MNFSRTFDYRRLLRGSHRGHLQKSVHAHHALITGIEPFTRSRSTFPRGIFPNRYCPLRFSPLSAPSSISLSLSLSASLLSSSERNENKGNERRELSPASPSLHARGANRREKRRGGTPVFCRWFRLRFETLDLGHASATTYLHNDRPREASKPEAR